MRHGSFPPLWWKQLDLFIALYSKDKDQSAQQEEEEEERAKLITNSSLDYNLHHAYRRCNCVANGNPEKVRILNKSTYFDIYTTCVKIKITV